MHNIVKNREELEQTLHDRKYKLACLYCQTYHQEEKGIKLLKQLLEHLERYCIARELLEQTLHEIQTGLSLLSVKMFLQLWGCDDIMTFQSLRSGTIFY